MTRLRGIECAPAEEFTNSDDRILTALHYLLVYSRHGTAQHGTALHCTALHCTAQHELKGEKRKQKRRARQEQRRRKSKREKRNNEDRKMMEQCMQTRIGAGWSKTVQERTVENQITRRRRNDDQQRGLRIEKRKHPNEFGKWSKWKDAATSAGDRHDSHGC